MANNGSDSGIVPAVDTAQPTRQKEAPPEPEISGDVSFEAILNASGNHLTFTNTVSITAQTGPNSHAVYTVKKKDLAAALNAAGITDTIVTVYRDNAGNKSLQRLKDLGFVIVAQHLGQQQAGSSIPPKDFYFMKKL